MYLFINYLIINILAKERDKQETFPRRRKGLFFQVEANPGHDRDSSVRQKGVDPGQDRDSQRNHLGPAAGRPKQASIQGFTNLMYVNLIFFFPPFQQTSYKIL